jgi:hypothetical protein
VCWSQLRASSHLLGILSRFDSSEKKKRGAVPPEKLFQVLVQSADNFGETDEWRALNFLAIRYRPVYELYAQMIQNNYQLESVRVTPSRLWRDKRIVDPIFAFRKRDSGTLEKYFVRLDVSNIYPIIVTELTEFFDR